jgi:hypothetical protein
MAHKPAFAEMYRVLADGAFCVSFYGWTSADKFLTAYRAAGFRVAGHFVFPKRYTSKTRFDFANLHFKIPKSASATDPQEGRS